MTIQYSTTHRTNDLADIITQLGTTAYLLLYTGSVPANCAAAATGTLLASLPCSNPFAPAPSSGVLTASAITSATAAATGTGGYWRLCTNSAGTTCVAQGTLFGSSTLTTSASTSANGNVLTFTSVTGVSVGQTVSGTGIPAGTTVVATSGTTVTLSQTSTAGVASSATITFGGDLTITGGGSFTSGQTVSVSSFVITATGA